MYFMCNKFIKIQLHIPQRDCADLLSPHFASDGIIPRCLEHTATLDHIINSLASEPSTLYSPCYTR